MSETETILIVDDDESTRRTLALIFGKKGYEIETAATAREALEKVHARFFNLALLDIKLPDMEGTDLVEPLHKVHPDMMVMMVTAHASVETALRALNDGASAYITKPLNMDLVLATVKETLEKQRLVTENRRLYEEAQRELAERKRAQQQLRQAAQELSRSNQELEQFAYVVSHDLQAPLRTMSGFAQLLNKFYKGKLDERADEFIQEIISGAADMKSLIDDLLQFSRVQRQERVAEPTDCSEALDEALAGLRAAIEESGAVVERGDLPEILASRSQFIQLFQNLVGNAIKYRGDARPEVHISAEPGSGTASGWIFRVRDNGIGMNPEHLDRIFLIFQRLHTPDEYSGTGIGLAICKKIVELHGGRIWAESEPGKGSTFCFTIED